MANNFDLRKFLSENKLTEASKTLNENEDRDREYFQALNKEEKIRQVGEKLARKIGESSILDELIETAVNLVDEQPGTPALMALQVAVETMEEEYQYEGNVEGERIASQVLQLLSNPRSLNETTQPKNNFKKEMANNFDLRKFLLENKLTRASKALNENVGNGIKKVAGTFMFSRFAPAQIKGELSPAHGTFFVVLYEETMNEAGIEVHQVSADQANAYLAYDRQLAASQGDPTQDAKLSAAAKAVGVPILGYESDLLVAPEGTTVQDVEALAGGDGETPAEIPGFEGTRDALGALGIRSENKLTRASKALNENYLELQTNDPYNYTTLSAQAVGPSKTKVTFHRDLSGEPDVKKVVNMSFDEFVEKLKAAGAEQSPMMPKHIFLDTDEDATDDLLRTLGFDL